MFGKSKGHLSAVVKGTAVRGVRSLKQNVVNMGHTDIRKVLTYQVQDKV